MQAPSLPITFAVVQVRQEPDPDTGTLKLFGYLTNAWRRYLQGVSMSASFLFTNTAAAIAAGATTFLGLPSESATETQVVLVMPIAATLRNLAAHASAAAGAAQSFTYTVRKNAADTAVTCAIAGASQTANRDTSNGVAVEAGDLVTVKLVTSAGAAVTRHQVALEIAPA